MTRNHVTIAGGIVLGFGAILAGVSLARGQSQAPPAAAATDSAAATAADTSGPVPWTFALPPVSV